MPHLLRQLVARIYVNGENPERGHQFCKDVNNAQVAVPLGYTWDEGYTFTRSIDWADGYSWTEFLDIVRTTDTSGVFSYSVQLYEDEYNWGEG
jgi:hypothetical protein